MNTIEASLSIISRDRFEIKSKYNDKIVEFIKTIKSRKYDMNTRCWNVLITDYHTLVKGLQNLKLVKIIGFPSSIIKIFKSQIDGKPPNAHAITTISDADYLKVDPKIRACLFPFQIEGVKFMIGRNGRCLLADDMGLGKTVQALGAASYFRHEWPLLVICPSSVKFAWRDQMIKWLSEPLNISVINTSRDVNDELLIKSDVNSVFLISYDLVSKLYMKLMKKNFKVVIMDESHFIKDFKSARSKGCVPLLKKAKRVFLLSGTPALSRPSEMFTQIDCVNPSIYGGAFTEFGNRYCNPKQTQWGITYLGSTNIAELQVILEENVMLRRIKSDVLSQLPEKHREVIILSPEFLKKAAIKRDKQISYISSLTGVNRHQELLKYFHETGKMKLDAIKNYIDDLIESPKKTLFFAHHTEVLNAVEQQLITRKVGYIRIDGSVNSLLKRERAEKFQFDDSIQIAILSIVAAGTGINLTAASLVVFGELFWNPGILLQAENRCHRIGQKNLVNIHYLVAEKTADDFIWPLIQRKLEILSKVGINKENFKNSDTTRLDESFSEKDMKQSKILEYFEKDFIEEFDPKDLETNDLESEVITEKNNEEVSFNESDDGFFAAVEEFEKDEEFKESCDKKSVEIKPNGSTKVDEFDNDFDDDFDWPTDEDDW